MDELDNWGRTGFCTKLSPSKAAAHGGFVLTQSMFLKQILSAPRGWLADINCIVHVNGTSEGSWHLLVQRNTSEEQYAGSQTWVSHSHGARLLEQSMQDGTQSVFLI